MMVEVSENRLRLVGKKYPMAFDEIYNLYGKKVLNLAYRLTGNEEVAKDLTQDVFVKIFQNLKDFHNKSQLYTWIYRIAMNHFINHFKRERKRFWMNLLDGSVMDLLNKNEIYKTNQINLSPEIIIEKGEREKIVLSIINSLPIKYRIPLYLQRYEDMSLEEIASVLDITVNAVESRIHRAKKKLIVKFEPWLKYL
jgi:RNA polymerase sigma-70 factor (ECF subfamily)